MHFHGSDVVEAESGPAKSRSNETTFDRDIADPGELEAVLARQAAQLAQELRTKGIRGRTVAIKVRLDDWTTVTRARTLPEAVSDTEVITSVAIPPPSSQSEGYRMLMESSSPSPDGLGARMYLNPSREGSFSLSKSSSVVPSQSLSSPSHVSGLPAGALQPTHVPLLHVSVPLPHAFEQSRARSSSTRPSQSLSMPSHASSCAIAPAIVVSAATSPAASSTW